MKQFIKYIILFILPIVVIALPLEYMMRQVPNPYKYKYEWMELNARDVETVVLGSSHAFYGVRPEFLDGKAFNMANVSQDIAHDLYLLKYWGKDYSALKRVILPISYFTLFANLKDGAEEYRCRYYKMYMDSDDYPSISFDNIELGNMKTARRKIKKMLKHDDNPGYDEYGWGNVYVLSQKDSVSWNDGSEAATAVARHDADNWGNYADDNCAMLRDMALYCKQRDVRFILVTTPCWHSYTSALDKEQLKQMYQLICSLKKDFGVEYFDYLDDGRFVEEDFFDSNHLSDVGAAKFTRILNKDIQSAADF